MRFRNAGGAVVQVLMRSDFFATEAFFCDHGRHPFLEQRRGPGFCIMCSTVGWRRRIRSYRSSGMPMTSSATVGPRARQLRCLCNWDSLSSADFITNIAESSFRHTHPIDSPFVSGALRTHNERPTEVLCPRVTQAAMIAAASFGLRRSGTFATAASVRHGPPWPLPVNVPKSICQNSLL